MKGDWPTSRVPPFTSADRAVACRIVIMMSKPREGTGPGTLPTDPVQETGLSLPPRDPVIVLRVVGTDLELVMSPEMRTFTLGSRREPEVDQHHLHLSSRHIHGVSAREHVSGLHLLIERKGNRLWIRDQDSTNGTFVRDRRERAAEIAAGDVFRVGDVSLLAMDDAMRLLRPHVAWALGLSANAAVDRALEVISAGDPLLLLGEPGCGQLALATQVHRTSARRGAGFATVRAPIEGRAEQVAHLTLASRGTAFVDLTATGAPPAFFVGHLFGDTYHVRPIVAAPDFDIAAEHLGGENAARLRMLRVPPLRERRDDVPALLNVLFRRIEDARRRTVGEGETVHSLRVEQLGERAVTALRAFDWPDNFDDLERNAPRLHAFIEHGGNMSAAARALDVKAPSLRGALARIGVV